MFLHAAGGDSIASMARFHTICRFLQWQFWHEFRADTTTAADKFVLSSVLILPCSQLRERASLRVPTSDPRLHRGFTVVQAANARHQVCNPSRDVHTYLMRQMVLLDGPQTPSCWWPLLLATSSKLLTDRSIELILCTSTLFSGDNDRI
jgi:hypothetical protein